MTESPPPDSAPNSVTTSDVDAPKPVSPPGEVTVIQSPEEVAHLRGRPTVRSSPIGAGAEPTPTTVPGYEIESELGRGGMGVVYKARQAVLNRTVALKMLLDDGRADDRTIIRFLAEAEAVAAIDHPNVVRVFDYGESDGRPYMALEYVGGGTLDAALNAAGRFDPETAAAVVEMVARGVQAAHDVGIVHRDLKPANVLLSSEFGVRNEESPTSGSDRVSGAALLFDPHSELRTPQLKVTDFGLAKRARGADLTQTWVMMGTPGYMSPEQAGGGTKFVGPASDIWALGVILFQCLAGKRPFEAEGVDELLAKIIEGETPALRSLETLVPRDLEMICHKCLEKDPARRYPSAAAVADDLRRFLTGQPISARPPSLWVMMRSWAGQNFGSAGWAVPGGVAIGVAVGCHTLLQLLGLKLTPVVAVYERLPHEPRPLFDLGGVDEGLIPFTEAALILLIPGIVLATALLARPRNRSADVAAGLVMGLFAAVTFFAVGFGWWSVYSRAVLGVKDDLALLSAPAEDLARKYPDLERLPEEERRELLSAKVHYDLAERIPFGLLLGMAMSFALMMPTSVALMGCAGGLLRKHRRVASVALTYFERTLPTLVFAGYLFLIVQRLALHRMTPQYPWCYAGLLALTGTAVWAAVAGWRVPLRAGLQFTWIGYYAVTNALMRYEF